MNFDEIYEFDCCFFWYITSVELRENPVKLETQKSCKIWQLWDVANILDEPLTTVFNPFILQKMSLQAWESLCD